VFLVSVEVGLWKAIASSVLATTGVIAVGLAAVPVLAPHPQAPVEPVNVVEPSATTPPPAVAPAGWISAAEQYRAAQVQRAVAAVAEHLVSGSQHSEAEWLSGGGHLSRGVVLPSVKVTEKSRTRVDEQVAAVREAVREAMKPEESLMASSADTSTPSPTVTPEPDAPASEAPSTDPSPAITPSPEDEPDPESGAESDAGSSVTVRLAQANIKYNLSRAQWLGDYARVRTLKPDFITLNEAAYRTDAELAVGGYAISRSHDNASTMETPVLWRTDRWTEIASGTRLLTNRQVKWGVRAVNWVTVRNLRTNQVVSVISAHPAPTIAVTRGLLPEFMQGLAALTRELGTQGPVFVGGDLNVQYRSEPYPTAALASAGLQATYDDFGKPVGGTGDHFGGTIDYLLYQPGKGVTAVQQGKVEQASDHDTIWADFALPR
jgi:endonuclease/exonuclease/phosphatase (EEP) superfamily protein YafD